MKKIIATIIMVCVAGTLMAQPAKRRTTTSTAAAQAGQSRTTTTTTAAASAAQDRASLMFPTKDAMPEDVSWRRDVYRQLDLKQSKNSVLYYPVEPNGQQMNLFTCIFRLVLNGRISAYEYKMDGNESFAEKDKITKLVDFLQDQSIYYEEKNGRPTVADADIPSRQVLRYYLKESTYLDQRTGTVHAKVVALCPILVEGGFSDEFTMDDDDEFGAGGDAMVTTKPLFWVKYDDVAPYLSKLAVMSSDLNNVTNMTADDYFAMNRYDGKIYKTNNMQGQTLKDYCKTDSAMTQEQNRIEKQLKDFEEHLWGHVEKPADVADSTAVAQVDGKQKKSAVTKEKKDAATEGSNNRRAQNKKESTPKATSAPRVSARRERR